MKTILITGATRGLGLQTVYELAKNRELKVVMAVRNVQKGSEIASRIGKNVSAVYLDLSQKENIIDFARKWQGRIDGLINNAGVQLSSKTQFTPDGFEETIAVNHLAAFMLTQLLRPHLKGGRVIFIGSGTHNPSYPLAKMFGFRGARFTTVESLLNGESDAQNTEQQNMDRYATSKFLNMVSAVEFNRRIPEIDFYVLDPGLMPGTGLARTRGPLAQLAWNRIMPALGLFLPDTTTPRRSGKAAAYMAASSELKYPSGSILSYNLKPGRYVWKEKIYDKTIGKQIYEQTVSVLKDLNVNVCDSAPIVL